jgi:16S rRNA (cytosine967-C5)-methyltransferase
VKPRAHSGSGAARPAPGTAARVLSAAAGVLGEVLAEGSNAEEALSRVQSEPQRAAIHAIALGTLRWYLRLAPAVASMLARPEAQTDARLRALLVTAIHQIEYSSHAHATTVAASVDAARLLGLERAAGFINAILRRYLREREAILRLIDQDLAAREAHPRWLVEALKAAWPAQLESILAANNEHPPLCLRVDTARVGRDEYLKELTAAGLHGQTVPLIETAVTLEGAPPLSEIPGFAEGLVSVQDSSAQLAAHLLQVHPRERVLDACAAPGGKTGALLELAGGELQLTALDNDEKRLKRVADNLTRLGRAAHLVHADLNAPPTWWDGEGFDAILLDVPCSGTGVIRRHPDIKLLRRAGDIAGFASRQLGLLKGCWPLLRPGGRLLYVTCSVLPEENAGLIAAFMESQPGAIERDLPGAERRSPPLQRCRYGWQLLPGAGGDGFYYACLSQEGAP